MSDFLWSFMTSQPSKIWHYLWTFSNMGSISPIINTFCASTSVLILYWSLRIFKQLLFHRDIFLLIRINQKFNILLSFWLISINTFYASTYVLILYWSLRFISHRYSYLYTYLCFFRFLLFFFCISAFLLQSGENWGRRYLCGSSSRTRYDNYNSGSRRSFNTTKERKSTYIFLCSAWHLSR